jgi:tetratricopeptide (TPR) repeat protein
MGSGKQYLSNAYVACIIFLYLPSIAAIGIFCPSHDGSLRAGDLDHVQLLANAEALIRAEEYDSAVGLLENSLADGDSTADLIYLIGLAHDSNDNIPTAIECYHRALEMDSLYWRPYMGLGYLFDIFAQYDSMNIYLARAIRLSSHPESLYYDYAYSFDMLGRDDSALCYYHRAVEFDSLDSEALLNIGAVWGRQENLDSAAHYTRRSIRLEPNIAAACYNLAEILIEEDKLEEAIDQFQKALAIEPGLVAAKKRLGEIYELLGDSAMAEIFYREFVDTAPIIYLHDIEEVKSKLKKAR